MSFRTRPPHRSLPFVAALFSVGLILLPGIRGGAIHAQEGGVSWDTDARLGYFASERRFADGATTTDADLRLRIRSGPTGTIGSSFVWRVRGAGRFGTEQQGLEFFIHDHPEGIEGLTLGQVSLDELYLQYAPGPAWRVRVGRMQTKLELDGVAKKSLVRNDSPNTDVTWTDGMNVTYTSPDGWRGDVILQHTPGHGPTNALRPPLDFSRSESRITVFATIAGTAPVGAFVQRSVDLTYIPGALVASDGTHRDYVGLSGRAAAAWPLGSPERRLMLAGEVAYAPNTPSHEREALVPDGASPADATGGAAVQVSANILDLSPGHRVGVVYGQTQPGWLLSPDFRNNGHLAEGRYQWSITGSYSMEARLRWRRDLLGGVESGVREDLDGYVRLSLRF